MTVETSPTKVNGIGMLPCAVSHLFYLSCRDDDLFSKSLAASNGRNNACSVNVTAHHPAFKYVRSPNIKPFFPSYFEFLEPTALCT
jgi:hypothetical protein